MIKFLHTSKNEVAFSNLLSLRKLFPRHCPHIGILLYTLLLIFITFLADIFLKVHSYMCECKYIGSDHNGKDNFKNKTSSEFSILKWGKEKQDEFSELSSTSKDTLPPKPVLDDAWQFLVMNWICNPPWTLHSQQFWLPMLIFRLHKRVLENGLQIEDYQPKFKFYPTYLLSMLEK